LGCAGNGGTAQLNFFLGADDFFATHLHAFDAHHFVTYDADKIYILGWLAIDPIFVFGLAIFFAYFFRRAALGINHHLAVHPDQHLVVLDGFFNFGGN